MVAMRSSLRTAMAVVGLVALTRTGRAQEDDPETRAARARFKEGVEFYDKRQYDNARASFRQAYALKSHPAVLLNLAMSSLKGNHPLEASRYFTQWMRDVPSPKPADKKTADDGLTAARQKLARLEITGPAGLEVFVGAERVGTLPLPEAVDVEPGESAVKWVARDGVTETLRVTAAVGARVPVKYPEKVGLNVPVVAVPAELVKDPTAPIAAPAAGDPNTSYPVDGDRLSPGRFDRPETMVPVYIGAGVAVAGFANAILFTIFKGNAQDSAASVDQEIRTAAARRTPPLDPTGICVSTDPRASDFKKACGAYQDNLNAVNDNVTVANISLGVGIAGTAFAFGWYLFAPKEQSRRPSAFVSPPISVSPWSGGNSRGMTIEGRF